MRVLIFFVNTSRFQDILGISVHQYASQISWNFVEKGYRTDKAHRILDLWSENETAY